MPWGLLRKLSYHYSGVSEKQWLEVQKDWSCSQVGHWCAWKSFLNSENKKLVVRWNKHYENRNNILKLIKPSALSINWNTCTSLTWICRAGSELLFCGLWSFRLGEFIILFWPPLDNKSYKKIKKKNMYISEA